MTKYIVNIHTTDPEALETNWSMEFNTSWEAQSYWRNCKDLFDNCHGTVTHNNEVVRRF